MNQFSAKVGDALSLSLRVFDVRENPKNTTRYLGCSVSDKDGNRDNRFERVDIRTDAASVTKLGIIPGYQFTGSFRVTRTENSKAYDSAMPEDQRTSENLVDRILLDDAENEVLDEATGLPVVIKRLTVEPAGKITMVKAHSLAELVA